MFLDKRSRFFRRYELRFIPRHKAAAYLPLEKTPKKPSVHEALERQITANEALEVQPNGDIVELMDVQFDAKGKALTLLFHRASPDAADPMYRKKARAAAKGRATITVRAVKKAPDEEQTVSAHLVIDAKAIAKGVYGAALEEIPGISMSVIRRIISVALQAYPYRFKKRGKSEDTYCTFKPEGVQGENLENALKSGELNFVTLVRPAKPDFVDAGGMFEPTNEVMKLRVKGKITTNNWKQEFKKLVDPAKKAGWTQFNLDLELDDDRKRTIKVDRDLEAKEILFVRSEQVAFSKDLVACSVLINNDVVAKALKLVRS